MRILFFGDSITQGFWGVEGGWVEQIRKHYDALAVKDLRNNKQPEIFNLGISGDTTKNLLARIENETKVRKWENDPLVVVIAIGTNDDLFEGDVQYVPPEEFRQNLEKLIERLKPVVDKMMLVGNPACDELKTTPVFWGDFHYTNAELQRSEKTIEEVAYKNGLTYVPIFEAFKVELDKGMDFLADGLHPNDSGHKFIANTVLFEIDKLVQ